MKEMILHDTKMKVKELERKIEKLKQTENHFLEKAREWKMRALDYEKLLTSHGVKFVRRVAEPAGHGESMKENIGPGDAGKTVLSESNRAAKSDA